MELIASLFGEIKANSIANHLAFISFFSLYLPFSPIISMFSTCEPRVLYFVSPLNLPFARKIWRTALATSCDSCKRVR